MHVLDPVSEDRAPTPAPPPCLFCKLRRELKYIWSSFTSFISLISHCYFLLIVIKQLTFIEYLLYSRHC